MTRIHRYVVVEILQVLLAALLGTSLLFTVCGGMREAITKGLPPMVAVQALPYVLPETLRMTIPASLLFAICTVFGRMAAAEEITALKALGVNPLTVIAPALVLAYLLSLATFWLYDVCAVWSRPQMYRMAAACVDQLAYNALQAEGVFTTGGVTVTVRGTHAGELIEPRIEIDQPNDTSPIVVTARRAELHAVAASGKLRIECRDSRIESGGAVTMYMPDEFAHEFEVRAPRDADQLAPAELRMSDIPDQIARELTSIGQLKQALRADSVRDNALERTELSRRIQQRRSRLFRLQAETHRRLSNGFAVFAFAMVGIPVALWRRSADNASVFFTCLVPIALVYYPLLAAGETIARAGAIPTVSIWLAPAVVTVCGAVMLLRLNWR